MASNVSSSSAPPRRDPILDIAKYMDQEVRVTFFGGREVVGVLKGFDQLVNLVLDDCVETLRADSNEETTRKIGLVVCRGTSVTIVSPVHGMEEIANPFVNEDGE